MAAFREEFSKSKHIVVLTGAGVSAESGVPTFRGAGGLWRKFRAQVRVPKVKIVKKSVTISGSIHVYNAQTKGIQYKLMGKSELKTEGLHLLVNSYHSDILIRSKRYFSGTVIVKKYIGFFFKGFDCTELTLFLELFLSLRA